MYALMIGSYDSYRFAGVAPTLIGVYKLYAVEKAKPKYNGLMPQEGEPDYDFEVIKIKEDGTAGITVLQSDYCQATNNQLAFFQFASMMEE